MVVYRHVPVGETVINNPEFKLVTSVQYCADCRLGISHVGNDNDDNIICH